ncbi:hypothetical protein KR51_00018630 [Rubidibacter lacunae KORDI 51-2]|uniref:Uncharacterized protein n=1 Tax=Rubidibacter lacunae KORDI 51-2 TaxID=582515 RepID=U5DPM2_9CHRO|nr:hypothetical protein KR51_00018630 [Rubidibacter lacunae KORDI 51-2]
MGTDPKFLLHGTDTFNPILTGAYRIELTRQLNSLYLKVCRPAST